MFYNNIMTNTYTYYMTIDPLVMAYFSTNKFLSVLEEVNGFNTLISMNSYIKSRNTNIYTNTPFSYEWFLV